MKDNKRNTGTCNKFQRKGVNNLDAKVDSCCAWVSHNVLLHFKLTNNDNEICGIKDASRGGNFRGICCQHERKDSIGDCDSFNWPKGPAFDEMLKMAKDESHFYT